MDALPPAFLLTGLISQADLAALAEPWHIRIGRWYRRWGLLDGGRHAPLGEQRCGGELMSREYHFDDVVAGGGAADPSVAGAGQAVPSSCNADCSALATQNATQRASATDSARPQETTEPAATIQVAAGSSKRAPVTETGRMAGTRTEPHHAWCHVGAASLMSPPGSIDSTGCRDAHQPRG